LTENYGKEYRTTNKIDFTTAVLGVGKKTLVQKKGEGQKLNCEGHGFQAAKL
jgi:hypothetical protein